MHLTQRKPLLGSLMMAALVVGCADGEDGGSGSFSATNLTYTTVPPATTVPMMTTTGEPRQIALPVRIFPNPAQERVDVQTAADWTEPLHIRVFDSLGRLLHDYGADAASTLDLAGLPNGLLFVKIESAGRIATFRLMKEK